MSVDVLYVGGTGRSGSTVVANALGGDPSMVSVGELRFLWQRGIVEDRLCGCGAPFSQCAFWGEVLHRAYGADLPEPTMVHAQLTELTRLRQLPRFSISATRERLAAGPAVQRLAEVLAPLYEAICEVSGARVVVDSSKLPTYAMVLDAVPGLDVRVVHLVRDPRAAAFSWQRKKEQPDRRRPGYMERRGSLKSAVLWTTWNAALERGWTARPGSYLRRAYEQVVASPATELTAMGAMVGATGLADRFLDERTVIMDVSHTVAGNPARLGSGPTVLRLDDEWVTAMSPWQQRLVVLVAGRLMKRYGYDTALTRAAVPAGA